MSAILRLKEVTVRRSDTEILHGIGWEVQPGQNWVILGPNGAGKTTLLKIITGYLWPTSGQVEVLGEHFGRVDLRELRRSVAVVSDSLYGQIHDELSGFEVLIAGARAHLNLFGEASGEEKNRAACVSKLTGVEPLLEKEFGVMSSGERRRLLIARALMPRPRILILDEPCAGLDIPGREFVLETIRRVASAKHAPAIIFTTHHIEEILPVFTHVLMLAGGRQFASGTLRENITSNRLSKLFGIRMTVQFISNSWAVHVDR